MFLTACLCEYIHNYIHCIIEWNTLLIEVAYQDLSWSRRNMALLWAETCSDVMCVKKFYLKCRAAMAYLLLNIAQLNCLKSLGKYSRMLRSIP